MTPIAPSNKRTESTRQPLGRRAAHSWTLGGNDRFIEGSLEIGSLLRVSLAKAQKDIILPGPHLHRRRSRAWVGALAAAFEDHFAGDSQIRVLTQQNARHRAEFGRNELLYDLTVVRIATVLAPRQKKALTYVREVLWQVESEFARNGREALFDFNKLVLGSAQHKLFIGPDVHEPEGFLGALLPAARACTGEVYVALVPHPDRWGRSDMALRVDVLRDKKWATLESAEPAARRRVSRSQTQ